MSPSRIIQAGLAVLVSLALWLPETAEASPSCNQPWVGTVHLEMLGAGAVMGIPAYLSHRGRLGAGYGVASLDAPPEAYGGPFGATGTGRVSADFGPWGYEVDWASHGTPEALAPSCFLSGFHQFAAAPWYAFAESRRHEWRISFGPQAAMVDFAPFRPGVKLGLAHRWRASESVQLTTRLAYLPTTVGHALDGSLLTNHPFRARIELAFPVRQSVYPTVDLEVGANRNGPFKPVGSHYDRVSWYMRPYAAVRLGVGAAWRR